ncbi:MAG TPA: choice-of-anchor D domain-containing protein [Kofleriaceae bacterium]|nr:choice-of-anchor D domain-containing protein [Kofleriaceae bacterium]
MTRALLILAVTAARAAAAPATFHAEPAVSVVTAPLNTAGASTITLRNDGAAPITAGAITADPGCDAAVRVTPLAGFTLAAGAARPLTLTCTAAPAGVQRCGFHVRDPGGAPVLAFEAVCASAGGNSLAAPSNLDLGAVAVGATRAQTLTLTNKGADITALAIETTDLDGNFTVQAPCNPDARACDARVVDVAPGASFPITVACTPRAAGALTAQLYVFTGDGGRLASPIALTCNATAAPGPVLALPPGPIDLGGVEVIGATAQTTIQLANTGGAPLSLLDVQVVDAGTGAAIDWTYTAHAPCNMQIPDACTLAAGASVAIDLVFDPAALGVRDAALLVNFHDTVDRSVSIPLRGVGSGATLELLGGQTALDLGTVPVGGTTALTFEVTNRGTRDLTDAVINFDAGPPFTVAASTGPGAGFSVPAGATTAISVACAPTDAGTFTAPLQLLANDVQTPPIAIALTCAGDSNATLTADPAAVLLGEVRIDAPVTTPIAVSAPTATQVAASLDTPRGGLSLAGAPATTPFTLTLTAAPDSDGPLADRIELTPATGHALAVPIMASAVTAAYSVAPAVSLGTFCIQQATTPRTVPLVSTGSATIAIAAPTLMRADSPFELTPIAPVVYPTTIPPLGSALIAVTPRRQPAPGVVSDELMWKTDVAGAAVTHTTLTATFITDGVAIAPTSIDFEPTPIHLDLPNARQVTVQNCGAAALQLDSPQIPTPFSIDSPNFPTMLAPGDTATFSVGFHPTKLGTFTKTLVITSPQLADGPLMVSLTGTGIAEGGGGDAGGGNPGDGQTSFYACGCANTNAPGSLALGLVIIVAARRPRYRRRHGR